MSNENHLALPIGHRLGKYRVERILGAGGFAITYLAIDVDLDRKVAIKELLPNELAVRLPDLSVAAKTANDKASLSWARERFLDEARTIARFDHPNLVNVHEHFQANETAYIVMGCVEGEDLNGFLQGKVPTPLETLVPIVDPLLGALKTVHASGFLHRDIKPDNIRVTSEGVPVLIDFGSARHAVGAKTRDLTTILTPRYAPFEQYSERGNMGPWTDLYSLAGVIHKMLRGSSPPEAPDRERDDPYEPLADDPALQAYPKSFLAAVDKALHPHEKQRPQDADEWRQLLWQEIDLPTGYSGFPTAVRTTPEPETWRRATPPESPAASDGHDKARRKSPLVPVSLAVAALALLGGGILLLDPGGRKNEDADSADVESGSEMVAGTANLLGSSDPSEPQESDRPEESPPADENPMLAGDPESVPEAPGIDRGKPDTEPELDPPPPLPSNHTAQTAADLFTQGDRAFFDLYQEQVRRDSAAESLDGYNKGTAGEEWDPATLETVKAAIVARDRTINTLVEDSIGALEELDEFPAGLRDEGYRLRQGELKLKHAVDGMDTTFQQTLLDEFRDLSQHLAGGTKITGNAVKERLRRVRSSMDSENQTTQP